MPFVENSERPTTFWAKCLNIVATSLSTSLYDDSDTISFIQDDVMDDLTDNIPPYAGADESLFIFRKSLGDGDTLNFELRGEEEGMPKWSTSIESDNFGLIIDSEGGTEGSISYTSSPWKNFTNGSTIFSAGATTGKDVALAMKIGPVSAKTSAIINTIDKTLDIQSCAMSFKFALPVDIWCGHVLRPEYIANCRRNFYLGCSWTNRDILRGSFAFQNFQSGLRLQYGFWGSTVLYSNSPEDEDDCVAVGGIKICDPLGGIDFCAGAEWCSNGDIEPTFGLTKHFDQGEFPYTLSFGMTTDRDIGVAMGISVVDLNITLGAHRRVGHPDGLWAMPSLGLKIDF